MSNLDDHLHWAKKAVTEELLNLTEGQNVSSLARAIDDCNKAWDDITDTLIKRIKYLQHEISRLHVVIADKD